MSSLDRGIVELEALIAELQLSEKQVKRAVASAISATGRSVAASVAKEAAKNAELPPSIVRARFTTRRLKKMLAGIQVRALTETVPAILARAKQQTRGVKTTAGLYQGAFIRRGNRGKDRVFKRVRKDRYPLREIRIPLDDEVRNAFSREIARIDEVFRQKLTNRLKHVGGVFAK